MPQTIEQQLTEQWRHLVDAELQHDQVAVSIARRRIDELLDQLPRPRPATP